MKWFLESLGVEGLCHLLDSSDDRNATATSCFAYFNGKNLKIFKVENKGRMARQPTGKDRWQGWSDAFIYECQSKTWAELSEEEQNMISMTRRVLEQLQSYLNQKDH